MRFFSTAACIFMGLSGMAEAAPINGDGNLTSNVVMGTGIGNGSFSGATLGSLELALRAKLRYPAENTFNYDGDRTYTFVNGDNPATNSIFNIEFAVNTDTQDTTDAPALTISDYEFRVEYDIDPTVNTDFYTIGPAGVFFGFNSTAESVGLVPTLPEIQTFLDTYNVFQGSQNLGFASVFPQISDPDAEGMFDFRLSAIQNRLIVASTDISVVVGDVPPVPLPAGLPLMLAGIGGFAILRRRQRG